MPLRFRCCISAHRLPAAPVSPALLPVCQDPCGGPAMAGGDATERKREVGWRLLRPPGASHAAWGLPAA